MGKGRKLPVRLGLLTRSFLPFPKKIERGSMESGFLCKWRLLLLLILPLVIYSNSLDNGFYYDDTHQILENPSLAKSKKIEDIFEFFKNKRTSSLTANNSGSYRPLLMASYGLNYLIGGFNPIGYHIFNLFLHIGSVFLVYFIVSAIFASKDIGFTAALLFAVTPFNSETINYITARSSLLSAFFYLAAFASYIKFRKNSNKYSAFFLILFNIFFIASFLTKIIAVTLPVIILLYDFMFHGSLFGICGRKVERGIKLAGFLPYIILLAGASAFLMINNSNIAMGINWKYPVFLSSLISLRMLFLTLYQSVFPVGLNVAHFMKDYHELFSMEILVSVSALSFLFILPYLYKKLAEKNQEVEPEKVTGFRGILFFCIWFVISYSPILILPFISRIALFQENRGYLSVCGIYAICAAFGWLTYKMVSLNKKKILKTGFAALIIILSLMTVSRNNVWSSGLTLWEDAYKKSPNAYEVMVNISVAYIEKERYEEAEKILKKALFLHPEYSDAYYHLGFLRTKQGNFDEAAKWYIETLSKNPDSFRANNNLGLIYFRKNMFKEAIYHFKKAIEADFFVPHSHLNLGNVYGAIGDMHNARIEYEIFVKIDPENPMGYYNLALVDKFTNKIDDAIMNFRKAEKLGVGKLYDQLNTLKPSSLFFELALLYHKQGNIPKAIEEYNRVLKVDPDNYDTKNNLGIIYEERGEYDKALGYYKDAMILKPNAPTLHNNMGILYLKMENYQEAFLKFNRSAELDPNYVDAHYNLGNLYAAGGQKDKALEEFKKVILLASGNVQKYGIYFGKVKEGLEKYNITIPQHTNVALKK